MGIELVRDANPIACEIKNGIISSPALGNLVIGQIPIKDMEFRNQCTLFKGPNIRAVLVNNRYTLILRWDSTGTLLLRESKILCANFKYTTECFDTANVVPAGAVLSGSRTVAMRRIMLPGVKNQIMYSNALPVSAIFNPDNNKEIMEYLSKVNPVFPTFIDTRNGFSMRTKAACEIMLVSEEFNRDKAFLLL